MNNFTFKAEMKNLFCLISEKWFGEGGANDKSSHSKQAGD
jgi:hypothetical protein